MSLSFTASADDFIKECQAGTPGPDSAKICKCMSDKVSGGDRANAIEAMNKTNAALAKGTQADPSTMTPKVMKGVETVMKVQLECM
ncbi:hypothetical protein [Reyranella sp.]|uniref:hypothetical protein n=1 Tax=Reyranella sp. TaxID=1929291 RepID=UPI0025FDEF4E|nr:hypothetical protein [Reyranella sp.]